MALTMLDPNTALIIVDLQKGIVGLPLAHPIAGILERNRILVDAFHATEGLRVFERPDAASRIIEIVPSGTELDIDDDPDAIQSARENLELNREIRSVSFDLADLAMARLPAADVVTANLTGTLLVRSSSAVLAAVRPGGTLILSGLLSHERDQVCAAFLPAAVVWEGEEDGWVGLAMKKP